MHEGLHGNSLLSFYLYSIKLKLNWIDSKFCWLLVLSALIVWAAVHLHAEPINVSPLWHAGMPRCWAGSWRSWQDSGCRPCWTTWTLKASASSQTLTRPGTSTAISSILNQFKFKKNLSFMGWERTCPFPPFISNVTIDYFGSLAGVFCSELNSCT